MRFSKWDLIPVFCVILAALAVFLLFLPENNQTSQVEIYQKGQLVQVLPLSRDAVYVVQGEYTNVITVKDGKVAITETSCPGGDCAGCGWRDTAGSIVCLPNGVEVRIVGNSDVDIVVG